jgi:hypothetical protein
MPLWFVISTVSFGILVEFLKKMTTLNMTALRGPAATVNHRSVLSPEREPHMSKSATVSSRNLVLDSRRCLTPRETGLLTVDHNITLALT